MAQRRKLIAGNWKMNGRQATSLALAQRLATLSSTTLDLAVFPPFPYLFSVAQALRGSAVAVGAQDCSQNPDGAFTGDVSAAMLVDCGCRYVILGHSERRAGHGEDNAQIAAKMAAAHHAGLTTILCIGETDPTMAPTQRMDFLKVQLNQSRAASVNAENTIIAYEPVWAIGSGITPTPEQINAVHETLRGYLPTDTRILYGGSVKPDNAASIMRLPDVDGALVGGASLDADAFLNIIKAAA
jgi:triosephosphate isomerase